MADNSRAINRVFTRRVLNDLLLKNQNDTFDYVVRRYIDDTENKNNGELISEIYAHLGKQQRNEYYYMNTLLNKLLDGIHSVNTTTAFSQMHIGHSIADFVMINGEGRVYEIKSDLDNFERLIDQLTDYYKAFSKVSVLASIHELENVRKLLGTLGSMGEAVGIYVLTERDVIFSKTLSREPLEYTASLDHSCIFKLLRKKEYENVIMKYFGEVPQVDPVFHFRTYLERFRDIPILDAQSLAFCELKKRNRITIQEFNRIQPELKSLIYFSGMAKKISDIEQMLQIKYRR